MKHADNYTTRSAVVDKGYVKMIYDLDKEPTVLEIKDLIREIETATDEFDLYCELMKQIFLSSSQKN